MIFCNKCDTWVEEKKIVSLTKETKTVCEHCGGELE